MTDAPMAAVGSRRRAFIWKPAAAMLVAAVFVAVSGGSAVYASQGALPGDALYTVKLASEGVQEHLTISADRKFAVQAEHAARRLDETQELLERGGLDDQEREARVRKAITGYEHRLTSMKKIVATKPALEPIDDPIKLEDDVLTFMHLDQEDGGKKRDDGEDGERRRAAHRKERGEQLSNHLKKQSDRLRRKPLEIKD